MGYRSGKIIRRRCAGNAFARGEAAQALGKPRLAGKFLFSNFFRTPVDYGFGQDIRTGKDFILASPKR